MKKGNLLNNSINYTMFKRQILLTFVETSNTTLNN